MKKFTKLLLLISIVINIGIGSIIFLNSLSGSQVEAFSVINDSGTYDLENMDLISGDATINAADVILLNTTVTGNLYVTEKVENGSLKLKNVTVEGSVIVSGGGENSIILEDCRLGELVVNRSMGRVRVNARGKTVVDDIFIMSGAVLEQKELSPEFFGFRNVYIKSPEKIQLFGNYENITIEEEKTEVVLAAGIVDRLVVKADAGDTDILFLSGAAAASVELYAAASVSGKEPIDIIVIDAPGQTRLSGQYVTVIAREMGSTIEIASGSISSFIVEEAGLNISLYRNVSVDSLELYGPTMVKGQGDIELLKVKSPGSIVEPTPADIEIADNITVTIAGKEVPDIHSEPETIPDADPRQDLEYSTESSLEPSPDFSFEINDSLMPGKKIVMVRLNTSNPDGYNVFLNDVQLIYMDDRQIFYGDIYEEDALEENVTVKISELVSVS